MADRIDVLFGDLQSRGYAKDKTNQEFRDYMLAPGKQGYENRKQFFEDFKSQGLTDLETYEDFAQLMGLHAGTPERRNKPTYQPTAEEMAGFQSTINSAGRVAANAPQSYERKARLMQKRQGLQAPQRVNLGESNNLTPTEQHFNLETGETEQGYMTSAGNEYGSRAIADMEQREIDKAQRNERYRQTLPGQLEDAYAERDRLNAELAKYQGQWVDQDGRVHYANRGDDESVASLEAALRQNQQRITALEAERDDDGGTQFWRGFIDAAKNPSVQTFGLTDFNDMLQLMRIKNKVDNAQAAGQQAQLTPAEQQLMESSYLNNYAQSAFGDNRGFMYRAGGISMQALPFVAEFMATGGFSAISEKGAELGARAAEKLALEGLSKTLVKNLGVVAGDVAAGWAMANTTGAFRTAGDVMQRNIGEVVIDKDGNFSFKGGKSLGRSIYEAEVANTLEYYTEKLGEHLKLGSRLAKGAEKMGLSRLSKAVNYLSSNKWLEMGGIQDYPSEVVEEQANLLLNAALVGDNTFTGPDDPKSVINPKTQLDIWGGMLFSIGLMQTPRVANTAYNAAGYYAFKKNVDISDGNAAIVFGRDNWDMIKEQIDNSDNDQLPVLVESIVNGKMNSTEKLAATQYAGNLIKLRGYNMGMMAGQKDEEESTTPEGVASQSINQGYQAGRQAQMPDEMKMYVDEADATRESLSQYGNEFANMVTNSQDPVETLPYLMNNRNFFDNEQIAAAADFYQKTARAQGVMDAAVDNVDLEVERANAEVRGNTHYATGNLILAKGADDLDYYIIGGDVIADPETGGVSVGGTGGAAVVKDPITGKVSVKSPQELAVYFIQNADELIQQNETTLRQQLMQQADDDITFGSPANEVFDLEDTVTLQDGNGGMIQGQIVTLPNAVDGVFVVQTSDGHALQMTADDMNRRIVEHNGMEVERATQQAPAAEIQQPTEQTGNNAPENIPSEGNNGGQNIPTQSGTLNNATGENPANNQGENSNQPQSALSRIPVRMDANGKPVKNRKGQLILDWHKASVEDAASALVETTDGDMVMARDTASDMVKNAENVLTQIRKQKPKGEDPIEIAQSRVKIKRQEQEQQAIIKHWKDVNQHLQQQMREETDARQAAIEAAKSEEQRQREAEEARQRQEQQAQIEAQRRREQIEKDRKERTRPYTPLERVKRELADSPEAQDILNQVEPQSLEEWVSSLLRPHSMLWDDEKVGEHTVRGLQSELGLPKKEFERIGKLLAKRSEGGRPFAEIVDEVHEGLPEAMKEQYSDQDVRNALLELFGEGNADRMMHLTEENRIAQAREAVQEMQRRAEEYEMEAWAEFYHLTPEERETFEDFMQQPPEAIEQEIINQIIAENGQNSRSALVDNESINRADEGEVEGGEGQVQGQSETAGTGDNADEVTQGPKAATGEQAPVDDNVDGGTQGVEPAGEPAGSARVTVAKKQELSELFRQIGVDELLAERITSYEVDQLSDLVEDWEALNDAYGWTIEQHKDALKSKNKAERDAAQRAVDQAQTEANEAFEPVQQYVEGLQTKYELYDTDGVIPTPAIDEPRYRAIRQALIDAYRSGDAAAIQAAAQSIQQYVDEGLDSVGDHTEVYDEAEEYNGNDPEKLADQYIIRTFWDRYLDDDEDKEYIRTGLKPDMRQSEQLKPTDLRDAVRPESAELGVNEANARARGDDMIGRSLTEEEADELILESAARAEQAPEFELTPENWQAEFGNGILSTPIGDVKLSENQYSKTVDKGRAKEVGMIKPTLTAPDFIIEVESEAKDGNTERPTSYLFVKAFIGKDGKKQYFFKSVTVQKDGMEVNVSNHFDRPKRLRESLKKGKLLYRFNGGAQTEQSPATVSVTTPQTNPGAKGSEEDATLIDQSIFGEDVTLVPPTQPSSVGKGTNNSPNSQENQEIFVPYSSFEEMAADTEETVTDPAMQKALRKIVDKQFLHGSSNTRTDSRGFDYKFVYMAEGTTMADRGMLKPWSSQTEVEYNDDSPTATWIDEKEQRIYFIKYNPPGSVFDWDFLIVGYKEMHKPIGTTSSPEQIAQEEQKVDTNPTDGQKEAGNYQKGHIKVDGYDITIENPKGSTRRGTDSSGKQWEQEMHNTYGYIRGTEGTDGDHIDVFLSDNPTSGNVYVVDQVNPSTGEFDEHKVMYGFATEEEARQAYLSNYSDGWQGLGNITEVSREDFKKWVESSHRKTKPFAEYKSVKKKPAGKPAGSARGTVAKPAEKPKREHKRIVSDDQMEELRKKLRDKFGTLNAGIDVERMLLGAMYAVGKIERGVTKFADYAREMVDEIGDSIRPYLKAFYNAVRDMPEAAEYRDHMDTPEYVNAFDVDNFDKQAKVPDAITKAEQVVRNEKAKKQVKKIEKEVKQKITQGDLFAGDLFGAQEEAAETQQPTQQQKKEEKKPVLDKKDYRTYMTPEAREYFAEKYSRYAHTELAFIEGAVRDGVIIPVEEFAKIPEIVEAEQRVKAKESLKPFTLTDEEVEEYAHRLLDANHGSAVYENGKIHNVDGRDDFTGQVRQERKAFVIIGRPAGGKSSVFANPLSNQHGARIIDSDVVKEWFDEFDDGYGAGYVQNMSSKVADRALDIAAQNGDNLVIPRIGGNSVMTVSVGLRALGYDVQLYYNDVVPDTSYMRSNSRFAKTGRYLSLDYLTSIKDKPSKNFSNFAKKTIGDYLDECTEEQIQKLRGRIESLAGGQRSDLWRALSWSLDERRRGDGNGGVSADVERPESDGTSARIDFEAPIFSYAEWKSNDVAFGEKPKEIWNSKSGKPMPGKKEVKNNENKQEVSRKPESAGEGAGQASGAAERTGAERSPEPNRAERSGSGYSVEQPLTVPNGREARDSSEGPRAISTGGSTRDTASALPKHNNRRNNVGERGKDYAPTSPKARFNANVEAIKLMRVLMDEGIEAPTKDQMEALRQYSGWGGLGTYFNDDSSAENKILRDLLSDEEYDDAVMSINSAYFTPAMVIDSMWDIAKAMGFKGGSVLEGSAGIGNIIGQMPKDMSRRSDIEAVEIDKISGNILKLLYPDAKVNIQGFQDTMIRNGSVDLAITNVPFVTGLHVFDKVDKDLSRRFTNIHDFCIAKNIRKLREGGIGIFISSSGTLDKSNDLRAWITDEGQADVVGAFRLNNETFGGTTATSDIIVVRKRVNGKKSPNSIDISTATPMRVGTYEDKYGESHQVTMTVNYYFKEHPEMMAGEMAFGYEKGDTFRPGSYGLYPVEGKDQGKMLAKFAKEMAKAKETAEIPQSAEQEAIPNQLTMVKEGRMLVDDNGRLCVSRYGEAVPLNLNANKVKGYTKEQCFKDYQEVQKAVDEALQQQLNDPDDAALKPKLDALNKAYDRFVKRYGYLHKNAAISFLRNDIDFPTFLELEKYSETKDMKGNVTVTTKKSPIFTQRVLGFKTEPKPKTIKDALTASIFKTNSIDLEWITAKLNEVAAPPNGDNWTVDDVRKGILVSRLGFENPSTGQLEVRHMYLSGNVREKLAIAEAYNTDGKYAANVEELRKIVPMDIPAHLIDFTLGSSWIPNELYLDYLRSEFGLPENIKLTHIQGSWVLDVGNKWSAERSETNKAKGVYSQMFRSNILGSDLVVAALNNRPYKVAKQETIGYGSDKTTRTVVDQEATSACNVRIDEIKDGFKQYIRKRVQEDTELGRRIEKIYNDKFNALVPLRIDDEMLPERFEDANMNISLYDHQKRGVLRGVTSPTMLAHEVGTGKSFTLISTAMEMRRLGTAKKPMIVVQNATVAQMTADAKLLYPNAKVLSLSEKDRDAEGRRAFYAKIRFNDWDMIIIPQSTLDMIPDSPQRELQFIQEQIDEKKHIIELARAAKMDAREIRRLENDLRKKEQEYGDTYLDNDPANNSQLAAPKKGKKRDAKREAASLDKAETKAREKLDRAVDDVQYFDDLGVDAILVDEAHGYKHLGFETTLGRSVKGVDPSYSKKCAGLYNKTRAVFEKAGWKNVVFATGTPISNTAAEIWTFMKYLMPADVMKANDIYYFDDFVHNFGSINQMLEFKTNGKFNEVTRFAAYVNRPELMRIWMQVADIVRTEEVGEVKSKVPEKENGKDQDVFLPQSPSLVSIMAAVRAELERFENMDGKEKRENSSIPLTMYGIAKRAAIDPRLVDADAPDEPNSKTNAAVKEIVKDLEATKKYKGTVAVFCDNQNRKGASGSIEFNIFDDMKEKLVKLGVPEAQIAIIKSSMSITAKQKIFDKVNTGDVRVILGSTQTLGTGLNIQERLHLLIHMDAPDRPMDYTQRNGRIERQGNLHREWGLPIRILRFGVEDSLDVTAYQRLKTKSGFIDSIMNGKSALANNQTDRTIEEEEEGLFDNPVAVLSGSQFALKKNQAERQLRKMQGKYNAWEADQIYVSSQLRSNESWMKSRRVVISENEQALARMREMFPDGKVKTITVAGVSIDMTKDDGVKKLGEVLKEKINDPINATAKKLRENQIYNDETQHYTLELDGHKVNFEVNISRTSEWDYNTNKVRTVVHKTTSYKSPDLRIEDGTALSSSKSIREHLDNILEQYVSGEAYTDVIDAAKASIERTKVESAQLKEREGQPFQFTEELEQAEKQVEEYTELMKKELQEKEAKYAEQAKEAGESGGFDLKKAEGEDEEDGNLYSAAEDDIADGETLNRGQEQFAEGQTFPIHRTEMQSSYNALGRSRTYSTELMPDEYGSEHALLDALRNQYPEYYVSIEDGNVKMESWQHVMAAAAIPGSTRESKGTKSYVERKTRNAINAVKSLAEQMGLDVEVLTTTEGLEGKEARAKGIFNRKTEKIRLVLPNHTNQSDLIKTLLHEGVAHFGLRKMFGAHFATFLDNVYNNVSPEVKRRIDAAMKQNGWSRQVATEEYLARLAERTDFDNATSSGWWQKIKNFFVRMLTQAGVHLAEPLTDNELRYILWRSYDNLLHPDSRRSIFDKAKEITMQQRLGINRYVRERERLQRTGRIDTSRVVAAENGDRVNEEMLNRDIESTPSQDLLLSLSKINNDDERNETINELVRRVREGDARIVFMGQEIPIDRGNDAQIAGTILGLWGQLRLYALADETLRGMVSGGREVVQGPRSQAETIASDCQLALLSWAKASGHYISEEEVKAKSLDKDVWRSGAESRVYRTADGKKVTKFMEAWVYHQNPLLKRLEGITLQNAAGFDHLNILGYTLDENGKLQVVVEQDIVDGVTVDEIFDDEPLSKQHRWIDNYLETAFDLIRHTDAEGIAFYMKDGIVYKDLHGGNILMDNNGKYHVVDSYVSYADDDNQERAEGFSLDDEERELYSLRTKEPPKKTGIGYKVFVLKDGQLYPPMVANPNGERTPVGVWLDADAAPIAGTSKTGRPQVKAGGKGTQGGSGQLAYRPGWHLGTIPYALQFNRKDERGERTLFPNNFVWAEVEYADDVDYQDEARQEGMNANGKYQHSLAELKHVPTDGSYKYRTNPDPRTDEWVITGAMRVNKILSREEVDELVRKAGREPQKIQDGDVLNGPDGKPSGTVAELNAEIQATKEADEMGLLFSADEDWVDDVAQEMYEKAVAQEGIKFKEAWQDSMVSLKLIQNAIARETGKVATGAEDAYRYENRMHGRAKNMTEQYDWRFYRPMLKAFNDFCKERRMTQEQGMEYLISKSGLERNVYYAFRDGAKTKIVDEVKQERDKLEKDYAKKRISEADYLTRKQELDEQERTGVDEFMQQVRETFAYQHAKEEYNAGNISYTEYLRIIETVIRGQLNRRTPKRDADGNIVSDNYYDDNQQDYSGLTETFAKEMYDAAQRVKKQAQRAIDPQERRALWAEYDKQMRNAYITARQVAEDAVFAAEGEPAGEPAGSARGTVADLWRKINAATEETLRQSYESGLIDRNNYNKVRAMFDFYIPLRGWEEDKASDVYTYMGRDNVFSPAVKKTWGRRSRAENPLAYIGNIAVSTILSGHRNQMKQHFLNYVMNNPTSLVSISESWYENIAPEGESPVWILRTADTAGKSGDEIAQIVNDFNEEMYQKQREGKAMPVQGRLRLDVNATKGQKAEHVVEVQRAGHTYQLYINGNPKAAQALNGTAAKAVSRFSDTDYGKWVTKVNRKMAEFFTSKNPAFVISNLSRDLNMAGASVAINEGKAYNKRFIANVVKVLRPRIGESSKWISASKQPTGLMPDLMRKWQKGTLNESNEVERYFKEFMDEGGETGFVNMLSVDSFKEKMQKEIAEMNGSSLFGSRAKVKETSIHKGLRLLGDVFEFYNRCAEDATRFIVYMTSRQMGKTLEESIADAKDVTLNFNRKGTGGMWNSGFRDLFIFVNPAIQALANMYRMAKNKPLKFGAVTAAFVAGGALMPVINQWLLNMFGDDDDKQAYWNLPPWVRKNNLVFWIPFTKNFVTIPLAQEFRVFYGVGEMMSSAIMDHPVDKWGLEVFSSVADLVPINPTGNGGNLMVDFAPTMVQPLMQVGENVDFTGKPIWRDNQGNKHAPMYTKAYISTPTWMVKLSEGLNDVTGGNEGKKGAVESYAPFWGDYINNPAVWNHLLQGYFGGMYNTIAKTFDVGVTAASGDLPKIYQTPVINRFLNRPVERDNAGVLGEDYYSLTENRDALQYELRTWQRKAADGEEGAQEHVDEILDSPEWKKAEVVSHYEKIMKDLKAGERVATRDADKYDIKESISLYKQQMMEELNALDAGVEPLEAALETYRNAKTFAEKNRLRMRIERLMMRESGRGTTTNRTKGGNADVEKALSYIREEEKESYNINENYLEAASAENIRDDARIKVAKAKIKPFTDEYKQLVADGKHDKAAQYRQKHMKYFLAQQRIDQLSRAMNANKKLLGKGNDKAIMHLIDGQRSQMIKVIEGIE